MNNKHDISVLNGLIATAFDSLKGFEDAAAEAKSTRFADLFAGFARDRKQVVASLQAEVRGLGGDPEDNSSFMGAAHRIFMDLKHAFASKSDKAIIDEVERGEDHIKAKYEAALADTELSPPTRAAIGEAYTSVREGHDQMRDLKHSMEGAH